MRIRRSGGSARRLPEVAADQWLLVHRDLRDLPRVRAVMDSLIRLFQEERAALEGRSTKDRSGSARAVRIKAAAEAAEA